MDEFLEIRIHPGGWFLSLIKETIIVATVLLVAVALELVRRPVHHLPAGGAESLGLAMHNHGQLLGNIRRRNLYLTFGILFHCEVAGAEVLFLIGFELYELLKSSRIKNESDTNLIKGLLIIITVKSV